MHSKLNWLKVQDRALSSLLFSTWKIIHVKNPQFLYTQFKQNLDSHGYATRHASEGRFLIPRANTNFLKCTFIYRAVKEWNLLPSNK